MSRASRLLSLVQVLRRHRQPVSAQHLADELEVSVRSIYRDVETLRAQGASIEGEPGVGYLLKPGFLLPPLMFSDDEIEALVLGLRLTAQHGDAGLSRAAGEVIAKLRAVLPRDLKAVLDESGLLAGPLRKQPTLRIDLESVRRSIREGKKASIEYANERGALSQRVIWPIGIGFFESGRLVVAWCELRGDFRTFRADRMQSFTALDVRFDKPRAALLREWRERERIPAQLASG